MMPFWQLYKLRHCHFGMFSFLKKRFRLGFGVRSAQTHSTEVFSGIGILFIPISSDVLFFSVFLGVSPQFKNFGKTHFFLSTGINKKA
jgi:hypothetical protein